MDFLGTIVVPGGSVSVNNTTTGGAPFAINQIYRYLLVKTPADASGFNTIVATGAALASDANQYNIGGSSEKQIACPPPGANAAVIAILCAGGGGSVEIYGLYGEASASGGGVSMFTGTPQIFAGEVTYTAPIASEQVTIAAAQTFANGTPLTFASPRPKVPVCINIALVDANASVSTGTVTVTGVTSAGETVSDPVTFPGLGSTQRTTHYAFASVTSIVPSGFTGNTGVDTFSAGQSGIFGLPIPSNANNVAVIKYNYNTLDGGMPSGVSTPYMTYNPPDATNGTAGYVLWYSYTLTPAGTLS